MKPRHWFFVVGVLFYLVGIGFVIAGARAAREAPSRQGAAAVEVTPVASIKQIMKGIVGPAANVLFNAVSTTVSTKGVEEKAPETDDEWETVGNSAAALIESGNLLLASGRIVDKGDWVKMSQAMIESGKVAMKAVEAKSAEQLLASGEAINNSCDTCHRKYQRGS
jgi:hypothetical protein